MPPYAVYQAQAAQVMLEAIARSNGTRASVVKEMFKTNVKNGIMGTFRFDRNGDIDSEQVDQLRQAAGATHGVHEFAVVTRSAK